MTEQLPFVLHSRACRTKLSTDGVRTIHGQPSEFDTSSPLSLHHAFHSRLGHRVHVDICLYDGIEYILSDCRRQQRVFQVLRGSSHGQFFVIFLHDGHLVALVFRRTSVEELMTRVCQYVRRWHADSNQINTNNGQLCVTLLYH